MKARDNPFSTDRILKIRYCLHTTTWDALLARLESLNFRGAITGLHGAGKTTLLEDLEMKLSERGFCPRFMGLNTSSTRQEKRALLECVKSLGPNDILLLDGAEQLNFFEWLRIRWLTRQAVGLVISVHRPSRLPTLWHCTTDARLLKDIVDELASEFCSELSRRDMDALFEKHHGNLREALRELYDEFAELETGADPRLV